MALRGSQAPLQAEIWEQCAQLNEKKVVLDVKAKASSDVSRLELLERELQDLEERVWVTKQLIEAEKASLAASRREVQDLSAELKRDLEALHGLG